MADSDSDSAADIDIFESSLASLFHHLPVAYGDPAGTFVWTPPDRDRQGDRTRLPSSDPIVLKLASPPGDKTALQAHHVWTASLYLASLLLDPPHPTHPSPSISVRNLRVAELGAGAGLAGIAAARAGAREVVATDYPDETILDALCANWTANVGHHGERATCCTWQVMGHEWGTSVQPLLLAPRPARPRPFDIILLADVLWISSLHKPLVSSLLGLLHPTRGRAYLTAALHTGRAPLHRFAAEVDRQGGVLSWRGEAKAKAGAFLAGAGERAEWEEYRPPVGRDETADEQRGVVVFCEVRHKAFVERRCERECECEYEREYDD